MPCQLVSSVLMVLPEPDFYLCQIGNALQQTKPYPTTSINLLLPKFLSDLPTAHLAFLTYPLIPFETLSYTSNLFGLSNFPHDILGTL